MSTHFAVRRVVTGAAVGIAEDGVPAVTVSSPTGHGLSELLWLDHAPNDAALDGGDPPAGARGTFPADGAAACRLIRFPGIPAGTPEHDAWLRVPGDDPTVPGMHRSETLDLMVVVDGEILLGLDGGEYALRPGDAVVQRGTRHRWRVLGEQPCTFLSVLLSPEGVGPAGIPVALPTEDTAVGGRLLVTATDDEGRSYAAWFGSPAPAFPPGEVAIHDLWQTGGPLGDVAQGSAHVRDADGRWQLEPAGGGVAMRRIELAAGHDPGDAGWHATATIDVGVVLAGAVRLELADGDGAVLRTGDVVVRRGTLHRWTPVGDEPAVFASVMLALRKDQHPSRTLRSLSAP